MPYVKMNRGGNHRGIKYSNGTILEVSEALKQRIVDERQGSSSTQEEYEAQQKEGGVKATDKSVDYTTLNRIPLEKYAVSLGIDESVVQNAKNKPEIYELIKAVLEKKA
jgi:hypothetical protein